MIYDDNNEKPESSCTHDCSSCSAKCGSREKQSLIEKPHELSSIKKVIGIVSGKGGVGKSMVTSLLAVSMKRKSTCPLARSASQPGVGAWPRSTMGNLS